MSPQVAANPESEVETPEKRQLRLDRIKALIQQASSKEGDGQQAAWRACALIRKFGLDIIDPVLIDGLYKEIHTLKAELDAAKAGDIDSGFGPRPSPGFNPFGGGPGFVTQTVQQAPQTASFTSAFTQQWPPQPQAPPQPTGPGGGPMMAPAYIPASKFAGKCLHCRKVINIGDPCRWMKKVGIWCATTSCYSDWLANTQAAGQFNPLGVP